MKMVCSRNETAAFSIAGHTLLIKGGDSVCSVKNIDGFNVFITNEIRDSKHFVVNVDCGIDFSIENPIYKVSSDGYDNFFGIRDGVYAFESHNEAKNVHFCMEYRNGEIFTSSSNDEESLRFAMWFAFNVLGSKYGLFGVHSSCVVYDDSAVVFLGESGTGKSTHTRLWINNFDDAMLLNDDSPIVSTETGIPMVYGSPWSGKTPCYINKVYPLKAVVRLRQAPANAIRRLNVLESVAALFPSFPPAFAKIPEISEKMLASVSEIISQVPVYQLDCLPNVDAALLSRKTVFGK